MSPQVLSKEELRRIEIGMRLHVLRQVLPFLKEYFKCADDHLHNTLTEIHNLENEREAINQGQLLLEY